MLQMVSGNEKRIINSSLSSKAAYNIPLFIQFPSGLNIPKMYHLLTHYFEKHAIFRTSFLIDEHIHKKINDDIPGIEVQTMMRLDKELLLERQLISIEDRDLVRVVLCKVRNAASDYMFINIHHVLMDGFSVNLFLQDLIRAYLYDEPSNLEITTDNGNSPLNPNSTNLASINFDHYGEFKSKLLHKQVEAVHYLNEQLLLLERPLLKYSEFAICLAAFTISVAEWLKSLRVYLTYPALGRDRLNYQTLGNFVQLIPFYHEFNLNSERDVNQTIAEIQQRIFSTLSAPDLHSDGRGMDQMSHLSIYRDVVFDYKSGSLIGTLLDEKHGITLEEANSYRDEKYGLHVSVYKSQDKLTVHLISSEYELEDLQELLALFDKNVQALYKSDQVDLNKLITVQEVAATIEILKPPSNRQSAVYEEVKELVITLLEDEVTVGEDESFFDLGMDSLMLVKFKKKVKEKFNINLKISDFFNYYTTELLTNKIMEYLKEAH
ncbi:condensation domain-containing protein [Paenibacillus sp. N1-5-1-14]|uniref:condensation domain-containing protein n=1 Tax=Paenibacillus radicibacter TaxID=2972488 RepID=UPI002158B5E3|nr:condensation domain-containing protein [Paenibacillus radicibacter]MCR8644641.1 condensation domain-containing protein [Paenibacillus radicibacter]